MKRYVELFKQTYSEFTDDKAQRLAASLAYYTIFSIAPLLLIAVAIAGLVFGKSQAQAQILTQLKGLFGDAGGKAIQEMLINAAKPKTGTLAIIIGFITLLFGASGVFGQLKDAMNTIWNVEEKKTGGIVAMIKERFLSFAMVLGVGFLLLVSLVIDAFIAGVGKYAGDRLPGGEALWETLQQLVALAVITVLFAAIFRFLPDIRVEWRDVWFGAGVTAVLFLIGKIALGFWLGRKAVGSAYGAAGSLVVLLLWIFWSANILFFGAEFTQVSARRHGSMRQSEAEAESREPRMPTTAVPSRPAAGSRLPVVLGGAAGLMLGAIIGGIGATLMFVKSLKKLFT